MHDTTTSFAPPIVDIRGVTRRFGSKTALDDISLAVPRGGVFGLIGGNGAGKTTLIKHILGMFRAQSGTVQVSGLDPVQDPVGTLGRIGYLSEDRDLPDWMRVRELMSYTRAFFQNSDEVERVADRVAIIHQGRIILTAPMDEIKDSHRRMTLRFGQSVERPPSLADWIGCDPGGRVCLRDDLCDDRA